MPTRPGACGRPGGTGLIHTGTVTVNWPIVTSTIIMRRMRTFTKSVAGTLDELESRDPREAIAKRTHQGAPANLGLDLSRQRVAENQEFVASASQRFGAALGQLLGDDFRLPG